MRRESGEKDSAGKKGFDLGEHNRNRRRPDFIGIGVQKGGTSWLAACLDSHPQICVPMKETGFFSRWWDPDKVGRYEEKLAQGLGGRSGVLVGEFSTPYFHTPGVASRVVELYPDCVVILVLRNPVDRVESIVRHRRMRGRAWNVDEAIEKSKYADRLVEWLGAFPGMKVLFYENLKNEPYMVLRELWDWLGVGDWVPEILHTKINRGISPRSTVVVKLFDWLGGFRYSWWARSWWWTPWATLMRDRLKLANSTEARFGFNKFERVQLQSVFQKDVERVKEVLGEIPWSWYA